MQLIVDETNAIVSFVKLRKVIDHRFTTGN